MMMIYDHVDNHGDNHDRGVGITGWLERWARDRMVASSNPGRSGGRIFFSEVNFVF